ncbi:MAG: alpha-L-arabinofuranosidase C-terminal domain-containing protein [Acidobacteriota bacterium]|nr:alpha-L-arabinofuranosidase C-terminal domain-containing protein [Acidobacteriota bacterium]
MARQLIPRRTFVKDAVMGGAALWAARPGLASLRSAPAAAEARIEILPDEPIGVISPDLYGHFTEHIGGVVYDGIWVGENSPVPNIGGIRKALVDHMRRIKPSVVRWPGGCFADSYNWRDGIGPRDKRPRRTNFWVVDNGLRNAPDGPQKYDPNAFGTNEFVRFCRLIGAQPYLAANLRSASSRDFYEWVEYCNAPAGRTTLSDQRAAAGDTDPFGVRFWGVGNESWGCGGNFTPEEYATEFRRFTAWVPDYGVPLAFIGSGPSGDDVDWTKKFFAHLTERDKGLLGLLYGWGMHYYCGTSGKGQAIDFTEDDWYALLAKAVRMEPLILMQWAAMAETDPKHRVRLAVDEWGAWHRAGTEVDPTYLFGQTSTMRDALIAGLTLDIFNRHADKVAMANVAQLINNLHSLFLAREDKFTTTPNFHVFEMYAAHHGGQSLRTVFSVPAIAQGQGREAGLPGLAGSASLRGKDLVLTVVNPHAKEAREAEIAVRGASVKSGRVRVLRSDDIHAHNTFEAPHAVEPADGALKTGGASLVHRFPAASVTRLELTLS